MSSNAPSCSASPGVYDSYSSFCFYLEGTYRKINTWRKRYVDGVELKLNYSFPRSSRESTHIFSDIYSALSAFK